MAQEIDFASSGGPLRSIRELLQGWNIADQFQANEFVQHHTWIIWEHTYMVWGLGSREITSKCCFFLAPFDWLLPLPLARCNMSINWSGVGVNSFVWDKPDNHSGKPMEEMELSPIWTVLRRSQTISTSTQRYWSEAVCIDVRCRKGLTSGTTNYARLMHASQSPLLYQFCLIKTEWWGS